MPKLAQDPEQQRRATREAARVRIRADVFTLARDAGAEVYARPLVPGAESMTGDVEPLAGASTARDLELAARTAALGHIRAAREAGHSWRDIGIAMGLVPSGDAQQAGQTIADAAYTYAAGHPGSQTTRRYGRSFDWTCEACHQVISDRGPEYGPADDERGHADRCARLAASIGAWDAGCEAGQ